MEKKFYRYEFNNLIEVSKIVTVHYQELGAGYRSEEEQHDFWELIYADKRSVTLAENGIERKIAQGYAAFIKPNDPHYVVCNEDANIFIISFECRSQSMDLFKDRTIEIPASRRILLQTLMTEAMQTFRIPDFDPELNKLELLPAPSLGGEQIIKNTLEILLVYLLRNDGEGATKQLCSAFESPSDLHDAILNSLSNHIYGTFSLDELCSELHYGKTRLCTFFMKRTNKTIHQTYLEMKITEAKRLIRKGLPLAEIADSLGFSSPSHFISVFKKQVGRTPNEYAKSVKK